MVRRFRLHENDELSLKGITDIYAQEENVVDIVDKIEEILKDCPYVKLRDGHSTLIRNVFNVIMAGQPHLCDIKLYLNNKWYDGYISIDISDFNNNDIKFRIDGNIYYSYGQDTIRNLAKIQLSFEEILHAIHTRVYNRFK